MASKSMTLSAQYYSIDIPSTDCDVQHNQVTAGRRWRNVLLPASMVTICAALAVMGFSCQLHGSLTAPTQSYRSVATHLEQVVDIPDTLLVEAVKEDNASRHLDRDIDTKRREELELGLDAALDAPIDAAFQMQHVQILLDEASDSVDGVDEQFLKQLEVDLGKHMQVRTTQLNSAAMEHQVKANLQQELMQEFSG